MSLQSSANQMTARNAPCPCGSGRKFKRCHGSQSGQNDSGMNPIQMAHVAMRRGEPLEALKLAETASASPEKYRFLTQLLISRREPDDLDYARRYLRQWAGLEPNNPEPWQRMIETHLFQDQPVQATKALDKLLEIAPAHPNTQYYSAVVKHLSGHLDEALNAYGEAIRLRDGPPDDQDDTELDIAAAMQLCETAAGNYPGSNSKQQHGMFDRLHELKILENALLNWQETTDPAFELLPEETRVTHSNAWYNLGCAALGASTDDDRRIDLFKRALDLNPEHVLARLNLAFSMNYSVSATSKEIFDVHRQTGLWLESTLAQPGFSFQNSPEKSRPLRIAYLSSDFRNHSVAHFILPVLESHDQENFELFIYHNHNREDEYTDRARTIARHFRKVADLSDQALCRAIRTDQIDILIELNGLTEFNRMSVLAMKAAPIQISWIGYPNTTGLGTVDFRIVDEITDPREYAQDFHIEKLLYMPSGFSVYQAPEELPDVADPPFIENGFITFGSFNNMPKLNKPLIKSWSEILHGVKGSRFFLKNIAAGYKQPVRQLQEEFLAHGISTDRIEFHGQFASQREHLESFSKVDICLDSFPYNGTTTTCDSLIMGVPVITRAGSSHRSRVSCSLLTALALDSLIASDENTYIDAAVGLASDLDQMRKLRSGLRKLMQSSSLMDSHTLTRELETRLKQVFAVWCQKEERT